MATLELYLIRHGVAAERGDDYPDDSKRPLTSLGVARIRREARALEALDVSFDRILTSPFARSRQTADVLAETMKSRPPVVATETLAPAGGAARVIEELSRHARKSRIALVGHEPDVGELAARLIGSRVPIPFKKGAICRIDFDELPPKGSGTLRWLLPPRILRRLA
ncbi:MAG TPA: phosphohistidine phosphatase SixA [Vicinamibacterales bacterium]|nr:phosphohistidine phosphatase SixA [Vicinamibacterales bacterium]